MGGFADFHPGLRLDGGSVAGGNADVERRRPDSLRVHGVARARAHRVPGGQPQREVERPAQGRLRHLRGGRESPREHSRSRRAAGVLPDHRSAPGWCAAARSEADAGRRAGRGRRHRAGHRLIFLRHLVRDQDHQSLGRNHRRRPERQRRAARRRRCADCGRVRPRHRWHHRQPRHGGTRPGRSIAIRLHSAGRRPRSREIDGGSPQHRRAGPLRQTGRRAGESLIRPRSRSLAAGLRPSLARSLRPRRSRRR